MRVYSRKAVKEKSAEGTKHISLGCKPQVKEQHHSPALALYLNLEAEIECQQDGNEFAPKKKRISKGLSDYFKRHRRQIVEMNLIEQSGDCIIFGTSLETCTTKSREA
jgi:hypothetical protein